MRKITLIGAGSVVFAKTLVSDLLQFSELADSTICLMDIDPQRLKVAEVMMKKVAEHLKVPATIEATTDRRTAIQGANYVICTVQVGGYKPSTVVDFEIPAKYGLKQTIADTLGVGGVFRALRTIPVLLDIARDIETVGAPGCLFLNYTNPMAMNCWAVEKAVGIPHVGLCHSVFGTARMLAKQAQIPFEDVSYLVAGVNHMAFFLKFQYKGQDAYPLLFKALEDPQRQDELVRFEMMRRTGYFVTESSEHQSEYVPYFIHHGDEIIEQFNIPINEYIRRCEAIIATWSDSEKDLLGEGDKAFEVGEQSHEYGSYIIHSMETDTVRTVYGNVPNHGLIDNIRQGCNVEVPCMVDRTGLNPVKIGELPPQLAAICMSQINVQELTVEAALTAKREHIYHAVMNDPHTAATLTLDKIWAMCDELIEQHQKDGFLGEFAPTIQSTGRSWKGVGDRVIARVKTTHELRAGKGESQELTILVENPGAEAVDEPMQLDYDRALFELVEAPERIVVAAESETTLKVVLRNKVEVTAKTEVGIRTTASVLAIAASLYPRKIYRSEGGPIRFQVDLSGFPAIDLTLDASEEAMTIEVEVQDSDIKPNAEAPWQGSCVEFFTALDAESRITQLFLVPGADGAAPRLLNTQYKDVEGVTLEQSGNEIHYRIKLQAPLEAFGLGADTDHFLFDFISNLGALGDAHSGGRTSLGGSFESNAVSTHYAAIERRATLQPA